MIAPMKCGECRYFAPDPREEYSDRGGHCHRYPPSVVAVPTTQRWQDDVGQAATIENYRPWMAVGEWCGEWKGDDHGL